jgi:predicted TIM-barrel fold metal-dependent hydrolase
MFDDQTKAVTRRRVVGAAVAGAVAIGLPLPQLSSAEEPEDAGWIDAHVHVWSPDTEKYPLAAGFTKADMQPPSFTVDELFRHCRPAGVKRVVLIQMSFYEYDHRFMNEAIAAHPGVFSGVAIVDVHADDVEKRMERLAEQGSRGFRLHARGGAKDWGSDAGMARLWRKADQAGLAVCPLIDPSETQYVDALCDRHRHVTVVVDHFARIGVSGQIEKEALDALCRLARFPNVFVKTSAFYALGKKQPPYDDLIPMIRRVVDAFGPDRLMWASDCPFQVQGEHTYEASIALIRDRIDFLSDGDRRQMLRGTAEKVFFN